MEDTAAGTGQPAPQAQGTVLLLTELGEDAPHACATNRWFDGVTLSKEAVPQPTPPSAG